ncbi:MAG: hypothetical protein ACYSUV_17220 [Planctomycetota bacterium]|jgi:hypothetical protein
MKEQIRNNLDMIKDNMDRFNDFAQQFIDKKALRKFISIWRWYISHGYFNEKHPQPKGNSSNPPLGWLHAQLQGQTVPLHRDIAECIMPVVQSSLNTEHAARRIMNRLNMIYGYVTPEAAKADQQAHRDREDKKNKDRLRAAKARVDRKAERNLRHKELIEKDGERLGKGYVKKKNEQRKKFEAVRKAEQEAVRKKAREMTKQMRKEMKERRK